MSEENAKAATLEFDAIQKVQSALADLPGPARRRVVEYVLRFFQETEKPTAKEATDAQIERGEPSGGRESSRRPTVPWLSPKKS